MIITSQESSVSSTPKVAHKAIDDLRRMLGLKDKYTDGCVCPKKLSRKPYAWESFDCPLHGTTENGIPEQR